MGQRLIPRKYPVCIPHRGPRRGDVTMQVLVRPRQGEEGGEAAAAALAALLVGFWPRTPAFVFGVCRGRMMRSRGR